MKLNKLQANKKARILKIFGAPTRLRILSVMDRVYGKCVEDISDEIDMTHSAVSHQLAIMLRIGMVHRTQEGRKAMYRITKLSEGILGAVEKFV